MEMLTSQDTSLQNRLIPKHKEVLVFRFLLLLPYLYLLFSTHLRHDFYLGILLNLAMSVLAFFATVFFIPVVSTYVLKRDLFGYDVSNKGTPRGLVKIPESMGLVSGMIYLRSLLHFNCSTSHKTLHTLLKIALPASAAMLSVTAYSGGTTILIPKPFSTWLGMTLLDLGWTYKLIVGMLVVFNTNVVNIFAGINGLDAGQTIVIACSVLAYNLINILSASVVRHADKHVFSIYLTQPFVAVSLGLLSYNWYPSSVFVGDSFTYFAWMAIAVVAMFGHFSETLLFLMVPQWLSFICSLPQIPFIWTHERKVIRGRICCGCGCLN